MVNPPSRDNLYDAQAFHDNWKNKEEIRIIYSNDKHHFPLA